VTQDNFSIHSDYEFIGYYETFHHLPTPGSLNVVAVVLNTNTVYFYGVIDEDAAGWSIFSDNYYDFLFGVARKGEKIPFSPVMMHLDRDEILSSTTIRPITKLTASSAAFGTGRNDFGFQLLFFRGMCDDIARVELQLPGEKGLVENYLKPWLDYMQDAETVKMNFDISPDRIQAVIDLFSIQHGRQSRKILVNGISYLPKKISFMLSIDSIKSCQADLLKKGPIQS